MKINNDDVVYYKKQIFNLIKQAKKNGLEININQDVISIKKKREYLGFTSMEVANVCVKDI